MIDWIEAKPYLPAGAKRIIGRGSTFWVGELDEARVLKYPNEVGLLDSDEARNNLIVESKLYEQVEEHEHIIKSYGLREDGFLVLERAANGNVFDSPTFQGRLMSECGETILDGGSLEQAQYYCPRESTSRADVKTDLFRLGSTIFFLVVGHEPFPDITGHNEGDDEEVERRFRLGEFPKEKHASSRIVEKCWRQEYNSAEEVLQDLEALAAV
ncbi:serine threonine protein kinase [Colletotrichum plurivorum]|uniref:Serine threonine protein kinase n=1 Tax=Colletotrichum plurivorum TaxID=2175906 RepID=A0A8H6JVH5_9PEZI|nr:serine threonine protein kinase [Colletotrichum plurivorum]